MADRTTRRVYRNTATAAIPTWSKIKGLAKVDYDTSVTTVDDNDFDSEFNYKAGIAKEISLSFDVRYEPDHADIEFFAKAMVNKTPVGFAVVDRDITDADRFGVEDAYRLITKVSEPKEVDGKSVVTIETEPVRYEEPAGTLIEPTFVGHP